MERTVKASATEDHAYSETSNTGVFIYTVHTHTAHSRNPRFKHVGSRTHLGLYTAQIKDR